MHLSLGRKKQKETHISYFEDALTSAFFGTLRYLPARTQVEIFYSILASVDPAADITLSKLRNDDVAVDMKFWPNLAASGRIEPDLRIFITHLEQANINLLIECKWKSGASSDFQLLEQWQALPPEERNNTFHLYLVRDIQQGHQDRGTNLDRLTELDESMAREWMNRLFVISWWDIASALQRFSVPAKDHCSQQIKLWTKDMVAMFDRIGIREFAGFKSMNCRICDSTGPVFWRPFKGFKQFGKLEIGEKNGSVFFR